MHACACGFLDQPGLGVDLPQLGHIVPGHLILFFNLGGVMDIEFGGFRDCSWWGDLWSLMRIYRPVRLRACGAMKRPSHPRVTQYIVAWPQVATHTVQTPAMPRVARERE